MARRKREEEQEPVDYELVKLNGINVRIPTIKLTPRHVRILQEIVKLPDKENRFYHEDVQHLETFGLVEYFEVIPTVADIRKAAARVLEAIESLKKLVKEPISEQYRENVIRGRSSVENATFTIPKNRTILRVTPKGASVLAAFEKANKSDYSVESTPQQ